MTPSLDHITARDLSRAILLFLTTELQVTNDTAKIAAPCLSV